MTAGGDRRPSPAGLEGKRICIVLLTGLGDVVMGFPVVNALKRHLSDVHITWVAEPMPAGVLRGHPSVDRVVVYEKRNGIRGILDLRERLKGEDGVDLTLNLNYYFKSLWPTLLSTAPRRVGFDWARSRDGTWFAATEHLAPRPRSHTVDMFLEFLDHLGLPREPVEWRLELTEEERREQSAFFGRFDGRPVVALVPATANPRKDWMPDRFARVADRLQEDFGYRVMLVGGPGERETRIAHEIVAAARTEPVWALGDGVRRLVWLLDGSNVVVAPDTGPVHIARALDVPVIGLYGHTNPWRVGPYRRFEELWIDEYTEPDEKPDPSRFDPKQGRMERIRPEDVLGKVELARAKYQRARGDD